MNFTELVEEVYSITNRPDMVNLTESQVRAATLKVHQKDFFYRDIREVGVEFEEPAHITSFRPADVVPRYRKPAYLREWLYDGTSNTLGKGGRKFEVVQTHNAQDMYGFFKQDVYYLAGDVLQIRSSRPISHVLFGAFVLPDITPQGYSSWIADEYPYAIIHGAARAVFKAIGASEQAAEQDAQASEWMALLTINSSPDEGM